MSSSLPITTRGTLHGQAAPQSLSVGLVLSSPVAHAWIARALRDLLRAQVPATIKLIRCQETGRAESSAASTLCERYVAWDHSHYRQQPDAFANESLVELWPTGVVHTSSTSESAWHETELDVVIDFSDDPIPAFLLRQARFGVWKFHFGEFQTDSGPAPLFWEMERRSPVSPSYLVAHTAEFPHGRAIYQSWSSTDFYSLNQNRNSIYWKAASFLGRALHSAAVHGDKYWQVLCPSLPIRKQAPQRRIPHGLSLAKFLARRAREAASGRIASLICQPQQQSWFCAYRRKAATTQSLKDSWRFVQAPGDRFYADPFIANFDGRDFLLFEDYIRAKAKGVISACEIFPDGAHSPPTVVLEEDYHLSYPFVFQVAGQYYMIPETEKAQRVSLYRAQQFPYQWERHSVLMENVRAVDSTYLNHDGKHWLFCNVAGDGASSWDELHAFYAESPFGPWTPHAYNPVVSDVRHARPAGGFFYRDGELMRPAQDCSVCYGYAVVIHRVDRLTTDAYQETIVGRIDPGWLPGNVGTHTWNENDRYEVIDGKRKSRRFRFA